MISVELASDELEVLVDTTFPRVITYRHRASGATMHGNERPVDTVVLNGEPHRPAVRSTSDTRRITYELHFAGYGGVCLSAAIAVEGDRARFEVTGIQETPGHPVRTLAIPDHTLVSVRSDQRGARLAAARMYTATSGSGDVFLPITGGTPVDAEPVGAMYAMVHTDKLAAALTTNACYDDVPPGYEHENGRILVRTVSTPDHVRCGLSSGAWVLRARGATETEPLPSATVVVTGDRNDDGVVDWQDAAIALREVLPAPHGWQNTARRVAPRIPMNFGSVATQPFLRTLDETKRVWLHTDGLGQLVVLKGYQSDGHDSAHPDYGGNINRGAGGAGDLATLIGRGSAYAADFGVHVNAIEAYPEARSFGTLRLREDEDRRPRRGWDWLDTSYLYDRRHDATSGNRSARLESLRDEIPGLRFVYVDVWNGDGWDSRALAREINGLGWDLGTEYPRDLEHAAVWTHWATDVEYGGKDVKGINSDIVRFLRNHQIDNWLAGHPLLGGAELAGYEGWTDHHDYDAFIRSVFAVNLPTKYLQHFAILRWSADRIDLADNVTVSVVDGVRVIEKAGVEVLRGAAYLLPWNPRSRDKLYHYNGSGGTTTWALPAGWDVAAVWLYRLTDTGRVEAGVLPVDDGRVAIDAGAGQPYVVYPSPLPPESDVDWGEGAPLRDPSFCSRTLDAWSVSGDAAAARVVSDHNGRPQLRLAAGDGTRVAQRLSGLAPGTYAASAHVRVAGGQRRASLRITQADGAQRFAYTDRSAVGNYLAPDDAAGTTMHRMRVVFDLAPGDDRPLLCLAAGAGDADVFFAHVRVEPAESANDHHLATGFEDAGAGWFPFVKGDAGAVTDPRTHLSELNAPYTQRGWHGKLIDDVIAGRRSLKSHNERAGLVYRTLPQTLRLHPGRNYRVSLLYEASYSGEYAFVIGDGTGECDRVGFAAADVPTGFAATVTGSDDGEGWIGVVKLTPENSRDESDLVVDDLVVDDLGPVSGAPGYPRRT